MYLDLVASASITCCMKGFNHKTGLDCNQQSEVKFIYTLGPGGWNRLIQQNSYRFVPKPKTERQASVSWFPLCSGISSPAQ